MAVCSIIEGQISIKDIRDELRQPGNMITFDGLNKDQSVAVYAAIAKSADDSDGIGRYGLSINDLTSAGLIKPGLGLSDDISATDDANIFTGKKGINSVDDLNDNPSVQREILGDSIKNNLAALAKDGTLTGDETPADVARHAGGDSAAAAVTMLDNKFPDIQPPKLPCSETGTVETPGVDNAATNLHGSKRF